MAMTIAYPSTRVTREFGSVGEVLGKIAERFWKMEGMPWGRQQQHWDSATHWLTSQIAYRLWEERGSPEGEDLVDWQNATRLLRIAERADRFFDEAG